MPVELDPNLPAGVVQVRDMLSGQIVSAMGVRFEGNTYPSKPTFIRIPMRGENDLMFANNTVSTPTEKP